MRGRIGFAPPRDDTLGAEVEDEPASLLRVAGELAQQYVRKHLVAAPAD